MMRKAAGVIIAATAVFWLSLGAVAHAQNQAALPEADFMKFVKVNVELQKLVEEYEPALKDATENPSKRAALEGELKAKTGEVLAKNDVTPQRYREIYKIVDSDPQLRTKAMLQIEEQRKKE